MNDLTSHWLLDPDLIFLNHGSFGAAPRAVLAEQQRWRDRYERQPVRFFVRELEDLLDHSREVVGAFVNADPAGIAFVRNATSAVNGVLRSIELEPGDEIVVTTHEYNATRNVVNFVAARSGAVVVEVDFDLPIRDEETVVDTIVSKFNDRTRLVVFDHVSSQTAIVFPAARIVAEANERGIDTLVDGAHTIGMLPLDLDRLGASWYTTNCHKWICAPKGSAILVTREDRIASTRPAVISHGANSERTSRSRYHLEFDWAGTDDPSPILSIETALETMRSFHPDGWIGIRRHNRDLVLEGRRILLEAVGGEPLVPESMIGAIATVRLPDGLGGEVPETAMYGDPLQDTLLERYSIEVPVIPWPSPPNRLLRISAQLYNDRSDYEALANALRAEL